MQSDEKAKAPAWYPDWRGQTCVIVASGPSAADAEIYEAKDRARVIAINDSWRLAPWADALYGCDFRWWSINNGVPKFAGLKISQDRVAVQAYPAIRRVECNRKCHNFTLDRPGVIGWAGNSGFHALNLALQFGARRIVLVGYDMTVNYGIHWHGKHGHGLNNPDKAKTAKWREILDASAPHLAAIGATVINASPISALKAYPKMTLQQALAPEFA